MTNETPFGYGHPTRHKFNVDRAREWANLHERSLDALSRLPARAVISSRPILSGNRLVNEAFAPVDGQYHFLHQKHYFPAENGWQEQAWFETAKEGFDVAAVAGVTVGVLLCTELMFPEKARWLGQLGADLIAVPRATGTDHRIWRTAASMAAILSGAYVVSSNRVGWYDSAAPNSGGRRHCRRCRRSGGRHDKPPPACGQGGGKQGNVGSHEIEIPGLRSLTGNLDPRTCRRPRSGCGFVAHDRRRAAARRPAGHRQLRPHRLFPPASDISFT